MGGAKRGVCGSERGVVKRAKGRNGQESPRSAIETALHIYTSTRRVPGSIPAGFTILFLLVLVSSGFDATLCFAVLCGLLE